MRCLVGIDDTDSSRGYCTTYLAYRIATDLHPDVKVLPYPRLVRLNPNIPFKTRGNAAVCLEVEASDAHTAFDAISAKVEELSDVEGGANSGMVLLPELSLSGEFEPLYLDALTGVVSPHRVRRFLRSVGARSFGLGNGMGVVGAASCLGFSARFDHTYELIAYRRKDFWGTRRAIDSASVREMDARTFPRTFNSYDYQKRKVLVAPHGPDPVFAGVRGDSPRTVIAAFGMLRYDEPLAGHMVYLSNQHTDAHLQQRLEWKVFSSGWLDGTVDEVSTGAGGHVYVALMAGGTVRMAAAYEPTGDLRRTAKLLRRGDRVRAFGGVRRGTKRHPAILNMEKFELLSARRRDGRLPKGVYISSPRANRHLTKPLVRYGRRDRLPPEPAEGWLVSAMPLRVPA
jgi:tRNA(Ile2)-agmatinylcytidine synthase